MKVPAPLAKILLLLLIPLYFSACGQAAGEEQESDPEVVAESDEHRFESLLSEADINYTVPVSVPNIIINQLGYLSDSVKLAIFRGQNLPAGFQVVDAETGRTVFSGEIEERGYNEMTGEYLSYGYFSELSEPGSYYLEAQVVGRSYNFVIADNIYNEIFVRAGRQYYLNRCGSSCHLAPLPLRHDEATVLDVSGGWHQDSSGSKDVLISCKVVTTLLLSYELNGIVYGDQTGIPESGNQIPDLLDEIRYEIEWLMKMQDLRSGGIYEGVTFSGTAGYIEGITVPATKLFIAAMAKFSYIYQDYDLAFATECLRAADLAWLYLEQNYSDLEDEMYFQAAAEMYRASGYATHHSIVTRYLVSNEYQTLFGTANAVTGDGRQEEIMKGVVTYLLTKKPVERDLCNEIMKSIMLIAEDVSARARSSRYLTAGNRIQDNNSELLQDMFYLSIVNYVITNHEYGTVLENHLHYLLGRNSAGISYIDEAGALNYKEIDNRLGVMNHIESNSKLLFLLSAILNSEFITSDIRPAG
jgi:endoglucanase